MRSDDLLGLAAVFAGGTVGTLARLGLLEAFPVSGRAFPWATFVANVAGALVLGVVVSRGHGRHAFLGAGLCGALTTFSTFQLELLELLDGGSAGLAAGYATASLACGLAAAAAGVALGRRVEAVA